MRGRAASASERKHARHVQQLPVRCCSIVVMTLQQTHTLYAPYTSCLNRKVGDVAERLTRSQRNNWTPALGDPRIHIKARTHVTRHTSHVTRYTSHVTRHTSHVTRYTPHATRHTPHITHHTSHITHHEIVTRHVQQHCAFNGFIKRRRGLPLPRRNAALDIR